MTTPTQPLRNEHAHLLPHIERIGAVGDAIGTAPIEDVRKGVEEVHDFLVHHLIPHADAEDRVLYPAVAKVMGAPQATATMSRDHVEVGRLTEELAALRAQLDRGLNGALAGDLRRVLYGLSALVKVHFAKEEEVYLPILDAALTPEEAERLFEEMGEAEQAKAS